MNLEIDNQLFLVTGAGSGFGRAIAEALIEEGANVIANSKTAEKLNSLKALAPERIELIIGDITTTKVQEEVLNLLKDKNLSGAVFNAGGPPAKSVMETNMTDWDDAYHQLVKWKVQLSKKLIPFFTEASYGRLIFIESISVKQPVENLVLSNAFRMAMVGYVKTLSQEVGSYGITMNVMAPGYHDTYAIERIIAKKSEMLGISLLDARAKIEHETMMGQMGNPKDFASLALWLLSPHSKYISGQTISVDGGLSRGVFG